MALELRPLGVRAACAEVARLHRHLPRIVGGLFASSVFVAGELVGVGVASQPKARLSRDGFTVEITRVATDGHRNACSKLYGALLRASAAVGYRKAAMRLIFAKRDRLATGKNDKGYPSGCTACDATPGHPEEPGLCRYHGGDGFDELRKRLARWLRWRDSSADRGACG